MSDPSVLMIGWEYPPHNSGGLGVACEGLTQALATANTQVYFTLPYHHSQDLQHLHLIDCYDPAWEAAGKKPPFMVYSSVKPWELNGRPMNVNDLRALPGSELEKRVHQYANLVRKEAKKLQNKIDVIHAHDWMTFEAAAKVKQDTGVPFIAHIHSTEFDRIPSGYGSPYIHQTEYQGLHQADKIIAVSYYTKKLLVDKYGLDPRKIEVIHNGAPESQVSGLKTQRPQFARKRPVVVFMGRLTLQKGGEYFLSLAKEVLAKLPETLFVVAGNGDLYQQLLLSTASQGLSASVLFSGFLRGLQREQLLERADVFVMPSLSEPFGLVAVEAAQRQTPVIVSKTSGVSEVLPSAINVDFWDVHKMSQTLLELLENEDSRKAQVTKQLSDLETVTWDKAATQVKDVYRQTLQSPSSQVPTTPKTSTRRAASV